MMQDLKHGCTLINMFINLLKAVCCCICDFYAAQGNVISFCLRYKIVTFHEELKMCI
jgi:hypothetical protein